MPDVRTPVDGEPWPQGDFYDDAPLWSPTGLVDAVQSAYTTGALGLTFGVTGSVITATLALGRARVKGQRYRRTVSPWSVTVPLNTNSSLSRRDRLVLRRDLAAKTCTPVFLQGTPASNPTAPALTQVEDGVWDMPLHSWTTPPASSTTLTGFTDERVWISADGAGQRGLAQAGAPYLSASGVTGATNVISSIVIPDPGYPYRLMCSAFTRALVSSGSTWNLQMRIDDVAGTLVPPAIEVTSTSYLSVAGSGLTGVLTGRRTLLFVAARIVGGTGVGFQVANDANQQAYTALIVPA